MVEQAQGLDEKSMQDKQRNVVGNRLKEVMVQKKEVNNSFQVSLQEATVSCATQGGGFRR